MIKVALFASGSGTNVENIVNYFKNHKTIEISLIISDNKQAYVLKRAKKLNILSQYFSRKSFSASENILSFLKEKNIDFIVLAGFLSLVPTYLIRAYPKKIINIHPALLPNYGGKGMYGDNVHKAVITNQEKESGISIHYVNEEYDKGELIFQKKCKIYSEDTPDSLAKKIHQLEYKYFPAIIEKSIEKNR